VKGSVPHLCEGPKGLDIIFLFWIWFGVALLKTAKLFVTFSKNLNCQPYPEKSNSKNRMGIAIISVGDLDPKTNMHVLGFPYPLVRGMDPDLAHDPSLFS
jgi:hypothetical protein